MKRCGRWQGRRRESLEVGLSLWKSLTVLDLEQCAKKGVVIKKKKQPKKHNSVLLYNMCRCFPEVSVDSWPPACLPSGFKHRVVSIRGASLAAPQLNSDQFPSSRWRSVTLTPSSFQQQQQQWVRLEVRYLLQRLSASGSHTSGKINEVLFRASQAAAWGHAAPVRSGLICIVKSFDLVPPF